MTYVLPGLCQHFQCSCRVNGWAVNCLHGNGWTWPGRWCKPATPRCPKEIANGSCVDLEACSTFAAPALHVGSGATGQVNCQFLLSSVFGGGKPGTEWPLYGPESCFLSQFTGTTSYSRTDPHQGTGNIEPVCHCCGVMFSRHGGLRRSDWKAPSSAQTKVSFTEWQWSKATVHGKKKKKKKGFFQCLESSSPPSRGFTLSAVW